MPPSSPGQLFNYPGLLIVPGTRRSGAEAGPAPVNDWLFHHAPLGMGGRAGGRHRDRGSRRAVGSFRSVVASAFFWPPPHHHHHHLTQLDKKKKGLKNFGGSRLEMWIWVFRSSFRVIGLKEQHIRYSSYLFVLVISILEKKIWLWPL